MYNTVCLGYINVFNLFFEPRHVFSFFLFFLFFTLKKIPPKNKAKEEKVLFFYLSRFQNFYFLTFARVKEIAQAQSLRKWNVIIVFGPIQ